MASTDEQTVAELRELMHLQGALPVPADEQPDPMAVERVLWRVRSEDRRRRAKRTALLASAAAVVTAVTLTLSVVLGSSPVMALPSPLEYSIAAPQDAAEAPSAQATLLEVAELAAAMPLADDGDVHFVARSGWLLSTRTADGVIEAADLIPTVTKLWIGPDGSGRMDQARGTPLDEDGRLDSTTLPGPAELLSSDHIPAGTFDPHLPETLPRDPEALREVLLARVGATEADHSHWAWLLADEITQLHGAYVIPSDLTAAMWQALATTPTVLDLGTTTTRDGQHAHGIAALWDTPEAGLTELLLLHAATDTGQFIGTEHITLMDTAAGISEPTLTGFEVWLRQGKVQDIGTALAPRLGGSR